MPGGCQHVRHLEFLGTGVDYNCLDFLLTSKFSKLDVLKIIGCNISGNNDNKEGEGDRRIYLNIPDTTIDTLYIQNGDIIKRRMLLISLHSIDQIIKKYYIEVQSVHETTTEIIKETFDAFYCTLRPEDTAIISVCAKPLRKLELYAQLPYFIDPRHIELELF